MVNYGGGLDIYRERVRLCGKTVIWLRNKNNLNDFGGRGWSRSLYTFYKEKGNAL